MQFINIFIFNYNNLFVFEISNRLDLDDESSIPTWYSAILLFIASLLAFINAITSQHISIKKFWWALSSLLILFSIGEIASIHEMLLQFLHIVVFGWQNNGFLQNAWLLILPILLLFITGLIYYITKINIHKNIKKQLIIGFAVFISGALFVEILSSFISMESNYTKEGLLVALEEGLEIAGTIIIINGLLYGINQQSLQITIKNTKK